MKNVKILLAFVSGIIVCGFLIYNSSCTREDAVISDIPPVEPHEYGTDTISSSNSVKWVFDKTHASVLWESPYKGVASLITGRFNTFNATVEFREDHPELITLSGFVVLSSVNTGEPGRDQGCLLATFGTALPPAVPAISDTARLTSKSVEFDGKTGYIVTADLDFHGVKKEVKMQLNYSGKTFFPATDPKNSYWTQGLTGQFEFNAISDFGIVSTNIADAVVVKLNILFRYYSNR